MAKKSRVDQYIEICGGSNKADRLFSIYQNSHASPGIWSGAGRMIGKSRAQVFRENASAEGFSDVQIDALLQLSSM